MKSRERIRMLQERIRELTEERDDLLNPCVCTFRGACDSQCTCVSPYRSGGCRNCARYGNEEQRKAARQRLATEDAAS